MLVVDPVPRRRCSSAEPLPGFRLVGFGILVVLAATAPGCGPGDDLVRESSTVPGELHGVWHAERARYRGAFFECRAREIRFGTVHDTVSSHPVVEVTVRNSSNVTGYRIRYLREGQRRSFSVVRHDAEPDALRLEHNSGFVWIREGR